MLDELSNNGAPNLFKDDAFLMGLSRRDLAEESYLLMLPNLFRMGEDVLKRVRIWSELAEKNAPRLINFDAYGQRVDRLELDHAWTQLKKYAVQQRLIALGHDKKLKKSGRSAQTAMQILFSAFSSTYSCPLAMTDGAIKVLNIHAPKSVRDEYVPKLMARDEHDFALCGQWMTERGAGSDLRSIETMASFLHKEDDREIYRLYGQKWFASAIDSEYALVLAATPSDGPSLFLLKVWQGGDLVEGLRLERLKNKLGTRGLATAEVRLEGAKGILIGHKGQGIRTSSALLNITRFYNAMASASNMNRVYFAAFNFAQSRQSHGRPIFQHVLHQKVLADLDAKRAASIALCFEIARMLGELEHDPSLKKEAQLLRVLIPLSKMSLGKAAVFCASEAMEAMGGLGYLEDLEFAQMFRDAQVLPIWEGTTNMMLHDIMRAQRKERSLEVLLKELCERANAIMIDEADALRILRNRLQQISERMMAAIQKSEGGTLYLEPIIRKSAFMIAACAMAILLAEAKPFITEQDHFAAMRFSTFVENNLCGNYAL